MYTDETEISYIPIGSTLYWSSGFFKDEPFAYLLKCEWNATYDRYILLLQDVNNPQNTYTQEVSTRAWFKYLAPYDITQIQDLHVASSKKPRGLRKTVREYYHLRENEVIAITLRGNKRYYLVNKNYKPTDRSRRSYLTLTDMETGRVAEIFIHSRLRADAFTWKG